MSKEIRSNLAKPIPPMNEKQLARFWSLVEKTDTCWWWRGYKGHGGYGFVSIGGKPRRVHRVSLHLSGAELKPDLVVDHICRNRLCVNPEHLRQVTIEFNTTENSNCLSAKYKYQTACLNGHEYTPETLIMYRGSRRCRTCQEATAKQHWAKTKAKRLEGKSQWKT